MEMISISMDREFETYYNKYYLTVYGYFVKKIHMVEEAEDLTMDVFLKCWNKFSEFDKNKASFGTWLFVIANNRLKNYYRDRKDIIVADDTTLKLIAEEGSEDELLDVEYYHSMRRYIAKALELLPESQRQVIVLKYYKGLNANEIAERLELSPGNVRVLLSRGIARMRKDFEINNIEWEK